MQLQSLELSGFKSFAKKTELEFSASITAIVGPNGSGKSNIADAFRFMLGEQSTKALRGKKGEDLIWNGSPTLARANRASVRATFDNTPKNGKRLFSPAFDRISIERLVHRDGVNEYVLNDSKVRLKDITELLAEAHVGSSGHHIISQGEADRMLSASPRERKHFIEDALGLRVYHLRIDEALRKLQKTEENKVQVEALRKENLPHLRFLERQMEKIAKARELREALTEAYREHFRRERLFLVLEREQASQGREAAQAALEVARDAHRKAEEAVTREAPEENREARSALVAAVERARQAVTDASLALGRVEGSMHMLARRHEEVKEATVPALKLEAIIRASEAEAGRAAEGTLADVLTRVFEALRALVREYAGESPSASLSDEQAALERKREALASSQEERQGDVREAEEALASYDRSTQSKSETYHRAKETLLESVAQEREALRAHRDAQARWQSYLRRNELFDREVDEALALIGERASGFARGDVLEVGNAEASPEEVLSESVEECERRRKELERLKVRLEEMGGAQAGDIEKEYHEVRERHALHERELADLEAARQSLEQVIADLHRELAAAFSEGLAGISVEFARFFGIIFGGGKAEVFAVREKKARLAQEFLDLDHIGEEEGDEPEGEEGVEVSVSLPNKRVRGLHMLSGGERALTSIALIFAMVEVSAPPFIILDETDAALDEANSRRYGDMVEALAKRSQLILITHNRETMSRAGILYGVTMGSDGISRLLSVKFDEAIAVAK